MKLGLGTVQLGMAYGITNRHGRVPPETARRIIERALAAGIRVFDTAPDYGDAESVLGACLPRNEALRIVTKLPRMPDDINEPGIINTWVHRNVADSLRRLDRDRITTLLVHHAGDLFGPRGEILYSSLAELKRNGMIENIGASVYEEQEIDALLTHFDPDVVQVPINLLDQRLIRGGQLRRLHEHGVEIHGRSLLLQGLLATADGVPDRFFETWRKPLESFRRAVSAQGLTPLQAAVGFINTVSEINCAIIGVTSLHELEEILAAATTQLPPAWYAAFALDDARLLNPSRWPL